MNESYIAALHIEFAVRSQTPVYKIINNATSEH